MIHIFPRLFALTKLYENISSSPDLLCFVLKFIQNNLKLSDLYDFFKIDENYDSSVIGKSTTFEHFPVISMTLFNAVQWNQNISVENFLLNRSTLDFYHRFMIHNHSWLKTSFRNDFAQNYSQLSIGLDHAPESEVSLSFENFVTISNF